MCNFFSLLCQISISQNDPRFFRKIFFIHFVIYFLINFFHAHLIISSRRTKKRRALRVKLMILSIEIVAYKDVVES